MRMRIAGRGIRRQAALVTPGGAGGDQIQGASVDDAWHDFHAIRGAVGENACGSCFVCE